MENDPRTAMGVAQYVAATLARILQSRTSTDGPAFYIWLRPDRMIVSIDPLAVKSIDQVLSARFVHHLSTALGGRKVVTTNSRGVFLQVSYWPTPAVDLRPKALDLSEQPSPFAVPIGATARGPLWLSILDLASVLIGGSSRTGKSNLLHGWIQALEHGGKVRLYLWDGKENAEFGRYAGGANIVAHTDLKALLDDIQAEAARRKATLIASGYASVAEYNERNLLPIPPMILIVDECAFIPADCQEGITDLVARGQAWGVIPVLATQRPGAEQVKALVKTNLSTRIAFPVPSPHDSMVILGHTGADKLPKQVGRLIMIWKAKPVKAQAFLVEKPQLETGLPGPGDLELAGRSLAETDGKLSIPILTGWGLSEWKARKMLDDWQERGWVIVGRDNARYVSPALGNLISQTAQGVSSPLKPSQTGLKPVSNQSQGVSSPSQADTQPIKRAGGMQ